MQVNAISAYHNNINFEGGKKAKKNKHVAVQQPVQEPVQQPKHTSKWPIALAFIPIVGGMASCEPYVKATATASATADAKVIVIDSIPRPGGTDTIVKHDTIYIPPELRLPEWTDSLPTWIGGYLDNPLDGHGNSFKDEALLYMSALRAWDYNKHETLKLNLQKSDSTELRFVRTIFDPATGNIVTKNDIRVTKVEPGDFTIVKEDGTETDRVSGLLFNEDGRKVFAHSNGRDKVFVYDKQMDPSDENYGKFVFRGTVEPGYLDTQKYGNNILLNGILAEGTEDHYTNVKGKVMHVADLYATKPDEGSWELN